MKTEIKILLVDDDTAILNTVQQLLARDGFTVVAEDSVVKALSRIVSENFDVLITDLNMPGPSDGFTVVSAMRHSQPNALTVVTSGFPDVHRAMADIVLQADEILVKPFDVKTLSALIHKKTAERDTHAERVRRDSVASILVRDAKITIDRWLWRVEKLAELACVELTEAERTSHLREIITNIATRLRKFRIVEAIASPSPAAVAHGELRYHQKYTAEMVVQESRILQVCIFETIQRNLGCVDFSLVLPDVMLIADEVDAQLAQTIASYLKEQRESIAA